MAILTAGDKELFDKHASKERFHSLGYYPSDFHCLL